MAASKIPFSKLSFLRRKHLQCLLLGVTFGAGQESGFMVLYWHRAQKKGGREEVTKVPSTQGLELGCYISGGVLGELTECGALASTGKQIVQQTGWDCHKNGCNGKEGQVRVCCTQREDSVTGQEPQSHQQQAMQEVLLGCEEFFFPANHRFSHGLFWLDIATTEVSCCSEWALWGPAKPDGLERCKTLLQSY